MHPLGASIAKPKDNRGVKGLQPVRVRYGWPVLMCTGVGLSFALRSAKLFNECGEFLSAGGLLVILYPAEHLAKLIQLTTENGIEMQRGETRMGYRLHGESPVYVLNAFALAVFAGHRLGLKPVRNHRVLPKKKGSRLYTAIGQSAKPV